MNGTRTIPTQRRGQRSRLSRSGFTLVEMLVSVTLVLLMMVMFGEVFQLATSSVSRQRVMADNDQNARTVVTVLRADFDKRTFRTVVPFFPNESSATSVTPFRGKREGYFYINCNSSGDGTDDVLQFTVKSTVSQRNSDESPYFGAAAQLPNTAAGIANFLQNANQPDRDDGQVTPNGAASSQAAEVSYFLRGRRLYRRVMLIRDPPKTPGIDTAQPTRTTPTTVDYFDPAAGLYTGNFWEQFDFSAYRTPTVLNTVAGIPICARFVGMDFLNNDSPPAFAGLPYCYSLGQSWNRFGHNYEITANSTVNGRPREYSAAAVPNFFLGRWTHEETSNPGFLYPQLLPAVGNPMDASATSFVDTTPSDGVLDAFAGGPRAGVDLLLSNVHEFRVEVWDNRLGDFAPVGHSLPAGAPTNPGDYNAVRYLNGSYGPTGGPTVGGAFVGAFDTWHPFFDRDFNNAGIPGNNPDRPPYRALTWDATIPSTYSGFPPSPSPTPPVPPFTAAEAATFRQGYWAPGTYYSAGAPGIPPDIVFPCREDLNGNGFLDPGEDGANGFPNDGFLHETQFGFLSEDLNGNNVLESGEDGAFGFPVNGTIDKMSLLEPGYPAGMALAYRCIKSGTSGNTRLDEPSLETWSNLAGRRFDKPNPGSWSTVPGQIIHGNTPAEPDWIVEYNVRPLRAIRITVRFEHPTSKQMKQVTIVHSLRDTTSVP